MLHLLKMCFSKLGVLTNYQCLKSGDHVPLSNVSAPWVVLHNNQLAPADKSISTWNIEKYNIILLFYFVRETLES